MYFIVKIELIPGFFRMAWMRFLGFIPMMSQKELASSNSVVVKSPINNPLKVNDAKSTAQEVDAECIDQ
jgi:hypothetical protein